MSDAPLSPVDQLKGVLFQYVKLYERWSEDRQVFTEEMATHEALLTQFSEKLKQFGEMEPQVRQQLINSITHSIRTAAQNVGEKIGAEATSEMQLTVSILKRAVHEANDELRIYRRTIQTNQWQRTLMTVGGGVLAGALSGLLIVWLLLPKPTIPLTVDALNTYISGVFIEAVWPKLPYKIRKAIEQASEKNFQVSVPETLAKKSAPKEQNSLSAAESTNSADG